MDMESREKIKVHGTKRLVSSFQYAWAGICYAFKKEQNMTVHVLVAFFVVILGIVFKIAIYEWLFCFISFGLVIASELINTAFEAIVDLACPKIHPLAKIAKDTAAGAVLIFALVAFFIGLFIFIPKFIALF